MHPDLKRSFGPVEPPAINLVASSWGGANLRPRDEIILTVSEHYSSLVPWQLRERGTVSNITPKRDARHRWWVQRLIITPPCDRATEYGEFMATN